MNHRWCRYWALLLWSLGLMTSGCTSDLIGNMAIRSVAEQNTSMLSDGGLHAFLCGTGIPMSGKDRAGACTAILAAGQLIIVDTGPGSWANMADAHLPASQLTAILISHFHSDHIGDLGEVVTQTWMKGRAQPLDVYGPPGVEEVVAGFETAYALDHHYRVEQFGEQNMPILAGKMHPLPIHITAPDTATLIIDRHGLKVTAFLVNHAPATPAYGYRFEYQGRVLVISGDTAKSDNLVRFASNADVLIHEVVAKSLVLQGTRALSKAGYERMNDMARKVLSGHTAADEVVEEARRAHVKKLVFTHIAPSLPPFLPNFVLRWLFFDKQDGGFDGPIIFGTDGLWIEA